MPATTEPIARELGFTLEELDLNRAGALSSDQAWDAMRQALMFSVLTVFMLGLVFAVRALRLRNTLVRVLAVGASCVGFVGLSVFTWQVVLAAVERKVESTEGPLSFPGGGRGLSVAVNRRRVGVPVGAVRVLQVGERYRVYTLAHTDRFLSIEPVLR
jgi:hypothetical protein